MVASISVLATRSILHSLRSSRYSRRQREFRRLAAKAICTLSERYGKPNNVSEQFDIQYNRFASVEAVWHGTLEVQIAMDDLDYDVVIKPARRAEESLYERYRGELAITKQSSTIVRVAVELWIAENSSAM